MSQKRQNIFILNMKKKQGYSFQDESLAFRGAFHLTKKQTIIKSSQQASSKSPVFARFQKSFERKMARAKLRMLGQNEQEIKIITEQHEYDYKQFADQPEIQFSPISLLLLGSILLCINLSIAKHQEIQMVQFIFFAMFVTFVYNLVFILRANRLMPFLPTKYQDDKLKIAAFLTVFGVYFCLLYGWSASGGMIFAIIWESLAGRQGCFYLIILGAVVAGSITMEFTSPQEYGLKVVPSILFGIVASLIHSLQKNSSYAMCNQISLFVMTGVAWLYPFIEVKPLTTWQYFVLLIMGFSCYFNMLLIIKMMQTLRTSMVMGVMSGIIIVSTTEFVNVNNYVACLTIILSILVLLKYQYLDKE